MPLDSESTADEAMLAVSEASSAKSIMVGCNGSFCELKEKKWEKCLKL